MFIATIIFVIILFYLIFNQLNYWKRNGVHQQKFINILKDTIALIAQKETLPEQYVKNRDTFRGHRYYGTYQMFRRSLVIQDAELIKDITVKNFDHFTNHAIFNKGDEPLWDRNLFGLQGNEWKEVRLVVNQFFTRSKIKSMFEFIRGCSDQLVDHFEKQLEYESCITVDIKDSYTRFSIDVIGALLFGFCTNSLNERSNEFYTNTKHILPKNTLVDSGRMFLLFSVPKLAKLFGINFFSKVGSTYFLNLIDQMLKEREEQEIVHHDILDMLIKIKKEQRNVTRESLRVDVTSLIMGFIFASVETISTMISFMSYELALQTNVQKRLQIEVDATLKECDGIVTFEALNAMKYMDMVVSETLRKFAPVATDRVCTKPYVIQPARECEVPVRLTKGDFIWIPIYSMHTDPKLYPNPHEFNPERFNDENKSNINSYTYVPFGVGPRVCIAKRFSTTKLKLLIFRMLSNFDIVAVEKTAVPLRFAKLSAVLAPEGGFWLGLKRRHKVF